MTSKRFCGKWHLGANVGGSKENYARNWQCRDFIVMDTIYRVVFDIHSNSDLLMACSYTLSQDGC